MKVESVVADSPGNDTLICRCRSLIGLAFNTKIHYLVSTDSTVVYCDIPVPQGNGIPLGVVS